MRFNGVVSKDVYSGIIKLVFNKIKQTSQITRNKPSGKSQNDNQSCQIFMVFLANFFHCYLY